MNEARCVVRIESRGTRVAKLGLCVLAMTIAQGVCAAAWTLPEGTGNVFLGATATSNDRYFDGHGDSYAGRTYRKIEFQSRVEYGITNSWTAFGGPSVLRTSFGGSAGGSYFGLGYTDLGMRKRLYADGVNVLSVEATVRLPGASNGADPAEVGYTGLEYDLRALYGRGFRLGKWPAFLDAETAWRIRNGAPPSEYRIDLTVGARPAARWLLMLQSFNVISNGRGRGVFNSPYRYHKLQPSVVWEFAPTWSWQLGAVETVAGRNSWREQGVVTYLWHRF